MSYLSLLIALFLTNQALPANSSSELWLDTFFNQLVSVERVFLTGSLILFAIVIAAGVVLFLLGAAKRSELTATCGTYVGCLGIFLLALPALEWVTWNMAKNMAAATDPVLGIVNAGQFYTSLLLYVALGAG